MILIIIERGLYDYVIEGVFFNQQIAMKLNGTTSEVIQSLYSKMMFTYYLSNYKSANKTSYTQTHLYQNNQEKQG